MYQISTFILSLLVFNNCFAQDSTYRFYYEVENLNLKLTISSSTNLINDYDSLLVIEVFVHNKNEIPIYIARDYETYPIQRDSVLRTVLIDIGYDMIEDGIDYPIELIRIGDNDFANITIMMSYHILKKYRLAEYFNLVFGIGFLDSRMIDLNRLDWYIEDEKTLEIYINDYSTYYDKLPLVTISIYVHD